MPVARRWPYWPMAWTAYNPAINRGLAKEILRAGGALVSEFVEGTSALPGYFVIRNRIISGLSLGVLFTEGDAASGALHTVKYALAQGRKVMAVPGSVRSAMSAGPNNILREGGRVVTGSHDEVAIFADQLGPQRLPLPRNDDPRELRIRELISSGHGTMQELIQAGGYAASELADVMSLMEITGQLRNLGAGGWAVRTRA